MARRFQPITFEFRNKEYVVPPERIMGLIDSVEEHLTMGEIVQDQSGRRTIRFGRLAQAYAAALNYAGAQGEAGGEVTAEEVYISLFPDDLDASVMRDQASGMITALLQLMMPPKEVVEADKSGEGGVKGKGEKDEPATSEKPSSSPPTEPNKGAGA